MNPAIARQRLVNQHIQQAALRSPAGVVAWFGAMQAQEFEVAKWAIALRMRNGGLDAAVQRAFDEGDILRTHVMRPTWHFATPADIRWLLALTGPRILRMMTPYNRRLELDPRTLVRGVDVFVRSLRDRQYRTRAELAERLRRAGLPMSGQRLAQLVMHAELEGVICSGPRRARQFTYALIAERAPATAPLSRDQALDTLTRRYLQSHGPGTIRDFSWWSGLTTADAKRGFEITKARQEQAGDLSYWAIGRGRREATGGELVHLLPIYDEYLIAYRDRVAVPHGPVTFRHALVIRGQVAGTWRIERARASVRVVIVPLRPITRVEQRALGRAVERFQHFLDSPVEWSIRDGSQRDRQ